MHTLTYLTNSKARKAQWMALELLCIKEKVLCDLWLALLEISGKTAFYGDTRDRMKYYLLSVPKCD